MKKVLKLGAHKLCCSQTFIWIIAPHLNTEDSLPLTMIYSLFSFWVLKYITQLLNKGALFLLSKRVNWSLKIQYLLLQMLLKVKFCIQFPLKLRIYTLRIIIFNVEQQLMQIHWILWCHKLHLIMEVLFIYSKPNQFNQLTTNSAIAIRPKKAVSSNSSILYSQIKILFINVKFLPHHIFRQHGPIWRCNKISKNKLDPFKHLFPV